jgi:RNA polymerase sigma-70 factor (ECF subfamily)
VGPHVVTRSHNEPDSGAVAAGATAPSLLAELKAGQPDAWRRLVRLYGPLVYGWCKRQGLQPADAEDVTQEVFRTVHARVGAFRHGRPGDTFRGWLWTITRNKIGDHRRRRVTQPPAAGGSEARQRLEEVALEDTTDDGGPAPPPAGGLYRRALEEVRGEFEPPTWQAFWRVAVEGQRPAEAAAALRLSLNAVYLAKSRVLRRLRAVLGDLPDEAR